MPRKRYLLVVDDESSVLLTLRMILEKEDYEVITAESCAEALGLLDNGGRFDAVRRRNLISSHFRRRSITGSGRSLIRPNPHPRLSIPSLPSLSQPSLQENRKCSS